MASSSKVRSSSKRKAERSLTSGTLNLSNQLRRAILERGVSYYQLGEAAQVDPGQIARFMAEERDIRLDTASRLATALKLRLVALPGKVGRPSEKTARPLDDPDE